MKKKFLCLLGYVIVFNTFSYSINNGTVSTSNEKAQNQFPHDNTLNKFCQYFINAQDQQYSKELNEKLANIKEIYVPYMEVINTFTNNREIETAINLIFSFEFYPYLSNFSSSLNDKLKCIFHKVHYNFWMFRLDSREIFIKKLTDISKGSWQIFFKNPNLEPNLNAFYKFIDEIFVYEKDSPLKNKVKKTQAVFYPYLPFLNGLLNQFEAIPTAIAFIFTHEYGPLLLESNSDQLKPLKEQLQPYIDALQTNQGSLNSYEYFYKMVLNHKDIIPTIIPNYLVDPIIKDIVELCIDESKKFFSLNVNSQNIKQKLTTKDLNKFKSCFNYDLFFDVFHELIASKFQISHFCLLKSNLENINVIGETNTTERIRKHKNGFIYLKITDFNEGFDGKYVQETLSEVIKNNNNLILDLRGNSGGLGINLMYLLSFFLPIDTPLAYFLTKEHEKFLDYDQLNQNNFSPESLKVNIENLKKNSNKLELPFEFTIAQTKKIVENLQLKYKNQLEALEQDYKEQNKLAKCFNDTLDFNFDNQHVQGKIAILYDHISASCAQLTLYFLKTFLPERTKSIGNISDPDGNNLKVISSENKLLPQSKLYLQYPVGELVSLSFNRLEGQKQKPDVYFTDPDEMMKAAEEWVKKN